MNTERPELIQKMESKTKGDMSGAHVLGEADVITKAVIRLRRPIILEVDDRGDALNVSVAVASLD